MMETEKQIAALQTMTRWLFVGVIIAGILSVGATFFAFRGFEGADTIQVKRLEVVNRDGSSVVELFADKGGRGCVVTRNERGRALAQIEAGMRGEGQIALFNGAGVALVDLGATAGGDGRMVTLSSDAQRLIEISSTVSGEGRIGIYSGRGMKLIELGANVRGAGFIANYDSDERLLVIITEADGSGEISTYNDDGQGLVRLGQTSNGAGAVGTQNGRGRPLVELGSMIDGTGRISVLGVKTGIPLAEMSIGKKGDGNVMVRTEEGDGHILHSGGINPAIVRHRNE